METVEKMAEKLISDQLFIPYATSGIIDRIPPKSTICDGYENALQTIYNSIASGDLSIAKNALDRTLKKIHALKSLSD